MAWRRIPFLAPDSQITKKEDYRDCLQKIRANRNLLILLQSRRKSMTNQGHSGQITEKQDLSPIFGTIHRAVGFGSEQVTPVTEVFAVSVWFLRSN